MKMLSLLLSLLVALTAFRTQEEFFTGKILYKYSFTDLKGNDIESKLAPVLGNGQDYYINNTSYKSYNQNKLQQLYNSKTNLYYFLSDNTTAQKIDCSKPTSQKFTVTNLDKKEKIAGYDCKAIQVETDQATIIYYFSPQVKTDKKVFAKHSFGEWSKYLEATNGALPLKYIMTNKQYGYIWTSTATEVAKMKLQDKDFSLPENLQVKE